MSGAVRIPFQANRYSILTAAPWLTLGLTGAAVLVHAAKGLFVGFGSWTSTIAVGALTEPALQSGELYRLISAAFVHSDDGHLRDNLRALWLIVPVLEAGLPRPFLIATIVLSSIVCYGGFAVFASPHYFACGLSVPIFALAGAYLAAWLFWRRALPPFYRHVAWVGAFAGAVGAGLWFFLSPEVHAAAFGVGALIGAVGFPLLQPRQSRWAWPFGLATGAAALACVAWPIATARSSGPTGLSAQLEAMLQQGAGDWIWLNSVAMNVANATTPEIAGLEQARAAADRAVRQSDRGEAWDTLAEVLSHQGDLEAAVSAQIEAAERHPTPAYLARLARLESRHRAQDGDLHSAGSVADLRVAAAGNREQLTLDLSASPQLPDGTQVDAVLPCSGSLRLFVRASLSPTKPLSIPLGIPPGDGCASAVLLRVDRPAEHSVRSAYQYVWLDERLEPADPRAVFFSSSRAGVLGFRSDAFPFGALAIAPDL